MNSVTPGKVIRQLALFEGRRKLKSPFLWLAFVASGLLVWLAVQGGPATLWARSVSIAGSCLPIAVVALLLGNAAALRDRAYRVGDTTNAPPMSRDHRMLGLVAAAWAPFLLSLGVVLFGVVYSVTDDPAGSFLIAELAVGPFVVVAGQATGVALGRWLPNPLAAPMFLVVLAGLFLIGDFWPGRSGTVPATSPFLPWRAPYLDWVQGEPRLPLVHLAYLVGVTALVASLAARRWRVVGGAAVVLMASVGGLSQIPSDGEAVAAQVRNWGEAQQRVCETHGGVRYCVIDGYGPWIDDWAAVVGRVGQLVPGELILDDVQQTVSGLDSLNDTDPMVAHIHGRLPSGSELIEQILAPELGLPGTRGEAAEMNTDMPACMARSMPLLVSGEGRAVAYIVLVDLAAPGSIRTGGFGGTYWFSHLEMSEDEADLALQIVVRPEGEILSVFHSHWDELTDPTTSSGELAEWFDLEAPEVISASSFEGMDCECTGDGISCTGRSNR